MGRMYSTYFSAVAVAALQDFFEILAASGKGITIHGWQIGQTTDVGDAAEESLRVECVRGVGAVTSGSGGSTHTPAARLAADTASGATVEINNTTRMAAGSGSLTTLEQHIWNVRVPLQQIYTPETRPYITPGNRWTLALPVAPADSLTCSGTVWFEEDG